MDVSNETATPDVPSSGSELPPGYDVVQSKPGDSPDPPALPVKPRTLAPHILVFFDGADVPVNAWGREGIARMGYAAFKDTLFHVYVSHPSSAPPRLGLFKKNPARKAFWRRHRQLLQHFGTHVKLLASFATHSGGPDAAGPVRMQAPGFPQMVRNVIEIHVAYKLPAGYKYHEGVSA